jgi:ethanolamine ammonia-lyase small subunit
MSNDPTSAAMLLQSKICDLAQIVERKDLGDWLSAESVEAVATQVDAAIATLRTLLSVARQK